MAVQWFNPYYVFGGEGGSSTGKVFTKTENGLVPAPGASAGDDLVLRSDGTWGQGGGGSATVGLGKQAKQAMWPGVYPKGSSTPFPTAGQWDFKSPEDFYKEMQGLPGYGLDLNLIFTHSNVALFQEYLRDEEVKENILKFIKFCHLNGLAVYAAWGKSKRNYENHFYIYTPETSGRYPCIGHISSYNAAARGETDRPDVSSIGWFSYQDINIPFSEGISLPSVSSTGETSKVPITHTGIVFIVRDSGTEVIFNTTELNNGPSNIDAMKPATTPDTGETLPYTPNYIGGCLSANISGYNNYGTLSSIKYDNGNLTFVNTQGATVITMPGATATGENELTLNDLQKIVYNEESSPKKLEIYDKTGTLRFTVNDTSSGT